MNHKTNQSCIGGLIFRKKRAHKRTAFSNKHTSPNFKNTHLRCFENLVVFIAKVFPACHRIVCLACWN